MGDEKQKIQISRRYCIFDLHYHCIDIIETWHLVVEANNWAIRLVSTRTSTGPTTDTAKKIREKRYLLILNRTHCVKSVQIRSFFWYVFSRIRTEYGEIWSISPHSVRMRENTDQKKLHIWTLFKQCVFNQFIIFSLFISFIFTTSLSLFNLFSTNVARMDKPGSWFLLAKCLKSTCGRVTL